MSLENFINFWPRSYTHLKMNRVEIVPNNYPTVYTSNSSTLTLSIIRIALQFFVTKKECFAAIYEVIMQTRIAFLPTLKQTISSISLPCTIRIYGIVKHYFATLELAIIEYESSLLLIDCSLIPQFYYEPTTMYYFYGKLDSVPLSKLKNLEEPFHDYCLENPFILQIYFYKSVMEMEQQGVNKLESTTVFPMQQYQRIIQQKYSL